MRPTTIQPEQPEKQRKVRFAVPIGGLFILFALIGVITVVISSINFTREMMDNTRQKEMLQDLIHPVVMFDPATFEKPEEIEMPKLLLYCMWGALSDDNSLNYSRSEENQSLLVPASDVEAAGRRVFGEGIKLSHETFTDNESVYFYDEETNSYEVPTFGFLYVYRPEVIQIDRDGELYRLLVSYIPPDNAWNNVYAGGVEQFSSKYMIYLMNRDDDGWHLAKVENPPPEILSKIPGAVFDDSVYDPAQYESILGMSDVQDTVLDEASSN